MRGIFRLLKVVDEASYAGFVSCHHDVSGWFGLFCGLAIDKVRGRQRILCSSIVLLPLRYPDTMVTPACSLNDLR